MKDILWGLGGISTIILIGFLFSSHRNRINWRTIFGGLTIQLTFAFLVLKTEIGRKGLEKASLFVNKLIGYTQEGINFLFGGLFKAEGVGFIFAFQVLPTIIFFSSLMAVLYHIGLMQKIVGVLGGIFSKLLGTSKAESLSAAGNIFVGQTEAPLLVRPYISKMTSSELFAVMVGGLASVAGSVLIGYSLMGIPLKYLLAAAFMAAPAGLVMAKLFVPETEEVKNGKIEMEDSDDVNIVDAAARGASDGMKLAFNVGAMLLAFIALIAMINGLLGGLGGLFGLEISLEKMLGYAFAPLAFVIGVPVQDILVSGSFIGQKLVLNEFVAFLQLGPMISDLDPKTAIITIFALTGFANFSSIAILLGGLGVLAPNRRADIARFGIKAVAAATLANLLSASIAGMFL